MELCTSTSSACRSHYRYSRIPIFTYISMPYIALNIACLPWSPSPIQCPIHSLSPADCLLRDLSWPASRDQSSYAPSQWESSLHCNNISHWLGAYLDWSLRQVSACLHGTHTRPVSSNTEPACHTKMWPDHTGFILDLRTANERQHYFVTTSLIGWSKA